jgi:hypothetical protein
MLTDTAIRTAKSKDKPYKLADEKGLYLLVNESGKYWRLKYRFAGKEKLLALGVYPEISLKEARAKRDEARRVLADNKDPGMVKRQAKLAAKRSVENAFENIAREWIEQQSERWTPDHAARVLQSLEQDAFPSLGARPVNEVETPEILDVVRAIERRGALETAGRVMQRCAAVFRYAVLTGRAKHNPAADLRGVLKTRKVEHRAALSRAELPELLRKIEAYDGRLLTRLALRFAALTFVRPGELRGARWEEFDMEHSRRADEDESIASGCLCPPKTYGNLHTDRLFSFIFLRPKAWPRCLCKLSSFSKLSTIVQGRGSLAAVFSSNRKAALPITLVMAEYSKFAA